MEAENNISESLDGRRPTPWIYLHDLYARRRLVASVVAGAALLAVVGALLLPNEYTASARVLPPEGGNTTSLLGSLSRGMPGAASLLGGGRVEYSRYLAILTSRTLLDRVVDEFDLTNVYGVSRERHPREQARDLLYKNIDLTVDREYRFLSVSVADRDPERAADIANYIVGELNRRNAELASQNAGLFRQFVESRLVENRAALDSVKNAVMSFQARHGVFDLEAQTRAFMEQTARLRGAMIELQIRHETLSSQYGRDNPQVIAAANALAAARRQYESAMGGLERSLPVAQDAMPALIREYVDLEQERLIQASIMEVVAPLYEQARLDEERETQAVQVVDYAVPPVKKSGPPRTIIVLMTVMSAFMLAIAYVLSRTAWESQGTTMARQALRLTISARPPRSVV
jgi:tyrosine-protein kinase Etk/Wzc